MKKITEKIHYILAFISTYKEVYIFKTVDRNFKRIYQNHASGSNQNTAFMFDQIDPPSFFLLEESTEEISSIKAYGRTVAWSKWFEEAGYVLVNDSVKEKLKSIHPDDAVYYESLLNRNLSGVLNPSNDLSVKFKTTSIKNYTISFCVEKKEYDNIKLQAFSDNLTIKEYCKHQLKKTLPTCPDVSALHNCITSINYTLCLLENLIRMADQNAVEDAGLPELLKILRAEVKLLRTEVLVKKEGTHHDK